MIPNYNPVTQALLGTLFTWGVTALGSALVFVFNSGQVKFYGRVCSLISNAVKVVLHQSSRNIFFLK